MYTNISLNPIGEKSATKKKILFGCNFFCSMKSFAYAIRLPVSLTMVSFFLCFSDCFSIPSPFALVWLITLMAVRSSIIAPSVGIFLGITMRLIWGMTFDISLFAGYAIALILYKQVQKGTLVYRIFFVTLALLPRLVISFIDSSPNIILLSGISLLIGVGALPAFLLSVRSLFDKHEAFRTEEKVCTLMVGAIILAGAGRIQLFDINIGVTIAFLLTLASGYVLASASGVIVGLIAGSALCLCGFTGSIMVQLCICGLCSGLLPKRSPDLLPVVFSY